MVRLWQRLPEVPGCPILGSVQDQVGHCLEEVEGARALGMGVGTRWFLRPQSKPFYDFVKSKITI